MSSRQLFSNSQRYVNLESVTHLQYLENQYFLIAQSGNFFEASCASSRTRSTVYIKCFIVRNNYASHSQFDYFNKMAEDPSRLWNILWSDEVIFYVNSIVNTDNYRIWVKELSWMPHFSTFPKFDYLVWIHSRILGLFFLEEISEDGLLPCSANGRHAEGVSFAQKVLYIHYLHAGWCCSTLP